MDLVILFLLVLTLLFAFIAFVVLFGELPAYRDTVIPRLRSFVVDTVYHGVIVETFEDVDYKLFNGRLSRVLSAVSWIGGWLVPLFYLVLMGESANLFLQFTFAALVKYDPSWTRTLWTIVAPSLIVNFGSFLLAVFCDPGVVPVDYDTASFELQQVFPYDDLIFCNPDQQCRTCLTVKPARSKHCSTCGRCVMMFDHHCVWLNNDVAYYNYRWFLLFLAAVSWCLFYGGVVMCSTAMRLFAANETLPEPLAASSTFTKYWFLLTSTTEANEISGILFILSILLFPILVLFLGEHIRQIYLGVTTNETGKWSDIKGLIEYGMLFHLERPGGESKYIIQSRHGGWNTPATFVNLSDNTPCRDLRGAQLTKVAGWQDMTNVYDKGFVANFKERVFPRRISTATTTTTRRD